MAVRCLVTEERSWRCPVSAIMSPRRFAALALGKPLRLSMQTLFEFRRDTSASSSILTLGATRRLGLPWPGCCSQLDHSARLVLLPADVHGVRPLYPEDVWIPPPRAPPSNTRSLRGADGSRPPPNRDRQKRPRRWQSAAAPPHRRSGSSRRQKAPCWDGVVWRDGPPRVS